MAELAAVAAIAQFAGSIVSGVSGMQEANANASQQQAEGAAAMRAAKIQADSLNAKGAEERAVASRQAAEKREEGRILAGRQRALGAKGGGGGWLDAMLAETAAAADLNARAANYNGVVQQRSRLDDAKFGQWQAKTQNSSSQAKASASKRAGKAAFVGSLIDGVSGVAGSKFGQGTFG